MARAHRRGCSCTGMFHPALEGSGYFLAGSFVVLDLQPGTSAESDRSFCLEICWVSIDVCRGKCKFGKRKRARKLFLNQPASSSPRLVCSWLFFCVFYSLILNFVPLSGVVRTWGFLGVFFWMPHSWDTNSPDPKDLGNPGKRQEMCVRKIGWSWIEWNNSLHQRSWTFF